MIIGPPSLAGQSGLLIGRFPSKEQAMSADTAHDAKVVDQFTRWAERFADEPIHAEADAMARLMAIVAAGPGDKVLDVACGPGIVACEIAGRGATVTGVDLTPAMIGQARARQANLGLDIDWRVADATRLPFEDGAFDVVVTRYSFHHMPEPGRALAEMARVCARGGRIVVADATPSPRTQAAYDRMETLRDPSHASALTLEQLRALAAEVVGLEEIAHDFHRLDARLETLADAEAMDALVALFEADVAEGADRIGVQPQLTAQGVRFRFPISILAWRRR
jgi:ubiquinone/menaquinone biosynthesis C-methylase UbiE